MTVKVWMGVYDLADDGSIDDAARYVFCHGQCHALAAALHDLTGWPIYMLRDDDHVVVKGPRGFLDINGYGADERNRARWGACLDAEVPLDRQTQIPPRGTYAEPEMQVAEVFARSVLREYDPEAYARFCQA